MVFLRDRKISSKSSSNSESDILDIQTFESMNNKKYHHLNKIKIINIRSFLINKKQQKNSTINKNNDGVPGPGTYNISKDFAKISINKNKNLSFLTNSPRFLDTNNKNDLFPGPGSYNLSENNNKLNIKKIINNKIFSKFLHLNNNRFVSLNNINDISIKQHNEYFENKDRKLILMNDLNINKIIFTEENKCLKKPEKIFIKKKNHTVDWNKMIGRNLSQNSNKTKNIEEELIDKRKQLNIKENNIRKKSGKNKFKNIYKNEKNNAISKQLKILSYIRKKNIVHKSNEENLECFLLSEKRDNLSNEFLINISENNKEDINDIKKIKRKFLPKIYKNSFSNDYKSNYFSQKQSPGPGQYFNNTYKYDFLKRKNIKNKINKIIYRKKIKNNNIYQNNKSTSSLLGPGSYNLIRKQFDKKSFNSYGSFPNEKRFCEYPKDKSDIKEGYNTPGPGQYNLNFDNKFGQKFEKKIITINLVNAEKEVKQNMNKKLKNINEEADFNNYQTYSRINIISSKIKRNINPISSKRNPFLSGEARFFSGKDFKENRNLGPGKYDIKMDFSHKNFGKNVPFNSSQIRELNYVNYNDMAFNNLSSNNLDLNNYFSWNKKSFNVMFI